jgi:hypothetical protein
LASLSAAAGRVRDGRLVLAASVLGLPILLALTRLVPADGVGLGARVAAAAACVLLLPGAVVVRALGRPAEPALALAAAFVLSLAVVFAAFALTFLVAGTIELTIGTVALVTLVATVPALRASGPRIDRFELRVVLGVVACAAAFAAVVWWATPSLGTGDVLFHLARARRLAETDVLSSVAVANEFADGGLHPGYAFPLWHGALALVATLAGVDVAHVVLHLSTLLVVPAFVVAYAAGRALFDSWAGGVAVLAAQVAQLGLAPPGVGSYATLSLPSSLTRVVLVPALLALGFAFLRRPDRRLVPSLAAASLAVTVVHPTYLVLVGIPVVAFAILVLALERPWKPVGRVFAAGFAGAAVPAGLFIAWLYPTITDQASHRTAEAERARALAHYADALQVVGDGFRMAPGNLTGRGPVFIAAFLSLPIAALAVRRRWGAFAAGGMLAALAFLLVPALFVWLSDLMGVSQARRLSGFLPVPFVIAAAAVLAGRLRLLGVALGLGLGVLLQLRYGVSVEADLADPGRAWPLWIAVVGGAAGLVAGIVLGRRLDGLLRPSRWTALVVLAFVLPIAIGTANGVDRERVHDPYGLTPGLVEALRGLDPEDVVFAPASTSHRVGAAAALKLAATIPHHAADTGANRPYRRQRDTIRFFAPARLDDAERRELLERYGADYLLVDKAPPYPRAFVSSFPVVYEDRRYLLLRVTGT